jgi:hypothetical protein
MIPTEAIRQSAERWFEEKKVASLELPRGFFGQPLGNLHELTWSAARDHKLLLELDRQLLLILTDPQGANASDVELVIDGSAQVSLDWQEYVNMTPHLDDLGSGSVRFVSPAALVRR